MKEVTNIFVPVDLDKNTEAIADYATFIAGFFKAKVTLFHAVEFFAPTEMALGSFSYEDYTSQSLDNAGKRLAELVSVCAGKGCTCSSKVMVGDIVDSVVDTAKEDGADLIIMGTHGKRGIEKILLGSVAERVLKRAHCPVLVVNPYKHGK